jgi:hypothetical protein
MEWLKDLSDRLVIWLLYKTSGFGNELTPEGRKEQKLWREQRRRNLDGLNLRSKERFNEKKGNGGL